MAPQLRDPRNAKRTQPMQVLCLGMSRSGTESLCKALEILGIPTYHGWRSMENHKQSQLWVEAMQAKYENKGKVWKREDFDQILGDYSACTDFPSAAYPVELIEAYPEAKVILNQRPFDVWYKSTLNTANALRESWLYWVLMNLDSEARAVYRCWWYINDHYFRHNIRRNAFDIYKEHAALVRGAAKPADASGNFLEYDVTQGWGPLCAFLGAKVPDVEFPMGNVAEEFHKRVEGSMKPRFVRSVRNLVIMVGSVVGLGWYGYVQREAVVAAVREVVRPLLK
uniref:P-loop containing nucleoside triphosphate hydrolase protein n=1 Tax=Mycosphaerella arachidis TaxID=143450 RepID=E2EAH4_9PEZI|nr:hypothetical protein [Passalora arachidicola]